MPGIAPLRPSDRPLVLFSGLCVVLGVVLRVQELGFPPGLTFDEHHFVSNARNYLAGERDWNDHPPLGKLLMALAMSTLGDTPVGWRLAPLLCGIANVALGGLLGARLFRSAMAGLLAALFLAIDGFLIAYSRTGLLDGMLVTFFLGALACLACFRGPWRLLLAGVLIGCALAVKLSGITLLFPLGVATWLAIWRGERSDVGAALAAWLLVPIVFLSWIRWGLFLSEQPSTFGDAARWVETVFRAHAASTAWSNPLVSRWYTWVVPTKPILMRQHVVDGDWVRVMTSLGNPLLWWSSALAVVGSAAWLLRSQAARPLLLLRARLASWNRFQKPASAEPRALPEEIVKPPSPLARGSAWLLAAHVAALSPWILTDRDSYIYHYLPSYTFGLILLAGWAAAGYERARARRPVLVALVLAANVSAWYAPLWGQLPLSGAALEARPFWRR